MVMAEPLLTLLEKLYPGSFKYWHIAKKCKQAELLFHHHPLIDQIVISDCEEGQGPKDLEIMKTCQVVLNTTPNHKDDLFPNFRNIYEETAHMGGFSSEQYNLLTEEEKVPKLYKWFETENLGEKTLSFWPVAGYAKWHSRNPTKEWYEKLLPMLYAEGFTVYQCGHPNDYTFAPHSQHIDCRQFSFFDQIKKSLGCSIALATDSGSSLVLGAYRARQVSLLTNHWNSPKHVRNFYAFGTNNPNNYSFFGMNHCDNIPQKEVLDKILQKCSV
jgi:ADP-heptose:LPS heptosyltransferase